MRVFERVKTIKEQLPCFVRLLAVSKQQPIAAIEEAIAAQQFAFGENYAQEAVEKIQHLASRYANLEWHYLGKIQKNKIILLARYFDWVQTIDKLSTAQQLDRACQKLNKKMNICLQVNSSAEPQKGGVELSAASGLADAIVATCPALYLRGLMGMGSVTEDAGRLRQIFQGLNTRYAELSRQYDTMDTLSMGMSGDFGLAITCGSTMVRLGTTLFGARSRGKTIIGGAI